MVDYGSRGWWTRPSVIGTVLGVLLLGLAGYWMAPRFVGSFLAPSATSVVDRAARTEAAPMTSASQQAPTSRTSADEGGEGQLSVREASLEARSDSIGRDAGFVHRRVEEHGGYVESSRGREDESTIYRRLETRVPSDRFDTYLAELRQHLDVTDFRTRDYRISIQSSRDEIEVLNRTLGSLDRLRERVDRMQPDAEQLELLMQVNDRELELARRLKREHRQLARAQRKSRFASVEVELRHRKSVDVAVWPEDFAQRFQQRLRATVDTLASVVIHTPARMLEIVVRVVQLALYLLAFLASIGAIGCGAWWLYRRVF